MLGMEMMLAKMIGKTPEELREISEKVTAAVLSSAEAIQEMRGKIDVIAAKVEGLENGKRNGKG